MAETAHIHVRCTKPEKSKFCRQCKQDDRSTSSVLRQLMRDYANGTISYNLEKQSP